MQTFADICSDMESERIIQEPLQSHCALPVFGMWWAPVLPLAREDYAEVVQCQEEDPKTPGSLTHPLHRALLSAQESIKRLSCENITLREEIARLTTKELSASDALEECQRSLEDLRSIYNKAQEENEHVEVRVKKMEEGFLKDKRALQALSRQQLGEISNLRIKLLIAQSHTEVKEPKRELSEGRRQVERDITSLGKCHCVQREESAGRLSPVEDHWREVIRVKEEDAATKLRESEERWQRRVSQLEEELKEKRSFVSSLIEKLMAATEEHRNTLTLLSRKQSELRQSKKECESKCNTLEEGYRKELTAKEECWRQKMSALEDKITQLTRDNTEPQEPTQRRKRKKWWRRCFRFRRTMQRSTARSGETGPLLAQSNDN